MDGVPHFGLPFWFHILGCFYNVQARTLYSWTNWLLNDVLQGRTVVMLSLDATTGSFGVTRCEGHVAKLPRDGPLDAHYERSSRRESHAHLRLVASITSFSALQMHVIRILLTRVVRILLLNSDCYKLYLSRYSGCQGRMCGRPWATPRPFSLFCTGRLPVAFSDAEVIIVVGVPVQHVDTCDGSCSAAANYFRINSSSRHVVVPTVGYACFLYSHFNDTVCSCSRVRHQHMAY